MFSSVFSSVKPNSIILLSLLISQSFFVAQAATKAEAATKKAKIETASESIFQQPDYVFDQQKIQSYGASNLYSLLNYLPGFQNVIGENVSAHSQLQVRGVNAEDGYLVLMIDGVQINSLLFNDVQMSSPYFDLSLAERVDVYTGPNAVKFGNNAALAVINVITKKSNYVLLEAGQSEHKKGIASLFRKTRFGQFSFFIAESQGDGGKYSSSNIPTSSYLDDKEYINQPYVHDQLSASWQLGNYALSYYEEQHEQNGFLSDQNYHPDNRFESKTRFLSNQLHGQPHKDVSYKADLSYTDQEVKSVGLIREGGIRPFSEDYWFGPNWASNKLELNISSVYAWSEWLSFEFGGQWQRQEQSKAGVITSHLSPDLQNSLPLDRYHFDELQSVSDFGQFSSLLQEVESHGLFTNVNWKMTGVDTLSAGVRLERNHSFSDDISMQFNYKRSLNTKSALTVEYSEGFRSPTFTELFSKELSYYGNPSLTPEKIRSFEVGYSYIAQTWNVDVTSFYQKQTDIIALTDFDTGFRRLYSNLEAQEMFGIETKADYQMSQNWKLAGTLTHYLTDTENSEFTTFGSLSLLGQVGRLNVGFNTILRSGVEVDLSDETSSNEQVVFDENPTVLVNAVINYQLGRSILFSFKIENAFERDHKVYDSSQALNQYYVTQQKQFASLSLTYEF
jgi:iron complex outermembrane receptor protein